MEASKGNRMFLLQIEDVLREPRSPQQLKLAIAAHRRFLAWEQSYPTADWKQQMHGWKKTIAAIVRMNQAGSI